jgi:hypothetical protein
MSKSSVLLEGTEGLLIRVQPNTYIEKPEHFRTAWHYYFSNAFAVLAGHLCEFHTKQ